MYKVSRSDRLLRMCSSLRLGFLALLVAPVVLALAPMPSNAKTAGSQEKPIVRPISISSLDNYFSVVGRFSGELTVFDDSIAVMFDTLIATRRLPEDQQRIRLDSIRVGVGVGDDKSWSPVDNSKALRIGRILPKGEVMEWKNVRFALPHERSESDDTAWIVVTFHITVGRRGESGYSTGATTYAHSERGVLATDK